MIESVGVTHEGPRFNRRTGFQFVCTENGWRYKACGWRSRVMKWKQGAWRLESEHKAWHRHTAEMEATPSA